MMALAAVLLVAGFATLRWRARSGRFANGPASPRRRRRLAAAGGALVATAGVAACVGGGWFGLIGWIGLIPVAAGAVMLALAYPSTAR